MAELKVRDKSGNEVETLAVDDALFGKRVNRQLLRDVVVMYEANRRQGTASTKTRSEIAGSGRKPWRQKGTGRARSGTAKSPLWRRGGVTFGPRPRDYSYSMPRKMLRKALASALLAKMRRSEIHIVDSLAFEKPRTKEMAGILSNLGLEGSVTVVVAPSDRNVHLSARNLPKVQVCRCADVNAHDILVAASVLATREAFGVLKERVLAGPKGGAQ
jgi:large subunit ribosomal protein L4